MKKLKVGVLGATGMVGQRFITLLENHPWFTLSIVAASPSSAGKKYQEAVRNKWKLSTPIPSSIKNLKVKAVLEDMEDIVGEVDMVFCALDLDKKTIQSIENTYASHGVAVISNNSAHRWTEDVPMIIPEINADHAGLIHIQRKKRGWSTGLIAVKPNCSIQSYVAVLSALGAFGPKKIAVTSLQAISGAGKIFKDWPEMIDNVIPYIGGEEEKSEKEPMKIWGKLNNKSLKIARLPIISATCIRVPVTDGHMAAVSVSFENKPTKNNIINALRKFKTKIAGLDLPSAPEPFITYLEDDDRPQTGIDRSIHQGMGVTIGRLVEDTIFDWKFESLAHNTVRGAAGGAILMAELLYKKGYIVKRIED